MTRTDEMRRYKAKNPWVRKYYTSRNTANKRGLEHKMFVADFRELWFRDEAWKLKKPSIDRIDNKKGYIKENCRYIELSENQARDGRGRKCNEKQIEASRRNMRAWAIGKVGVLNPSARAVIQKDLQGQFIKQWDCISDAARSGEFLVSGISQTCGGRYKTHKGYIWEYAKK